MAHEVRIPRLGWSMEEGTFVRWLKQPGESVAVGEPLFELEGEKASQEIESLDAGVLHLPPDSPAPGSVVPVGALLGFLLAPGEAPPVAHPPGDSKSSPSPDATNATPAKSLGSDQSPVAGPAVRRLARELGVDLNEVAGTGRSGRITREDIEVRSGRHAAPASNGGRGPAGGLVPSDGKRVASPRAKRIAAELSIDWRSLHGTGAGGRIREADVRAAIGRVGTQHIGTSARDDANCVIPLSARRKSIADRLRRSRDRTIPVTLTTSADATNLLALRSQCKAAQMPLVPACTDIVACLVAKVLKQHTQLAVRWSHDHQHLLRVADDRWDIGIAVDTPDGLLVPVIRDVAHKSLVTVSQESRVLVERARSGGLTVPEMQDGVMTITNLGALGIDAFTPIINYPEIAILGLGAIRRVPVVLSDDRIVPGDRITLSFVFDHAAIDGAPAASFLRDVVLAIENAAGYLLGD